MGLSVYQPNGTEVREGDQMVRYISREIGGGDTGIPPQTVTDRYVVGVVRKVGQGQLTAQIVGKTTQPLRKSFWSGQVPEAQYEVRVRRENPEASLTDTTISDTVVWGDLTEVVYEEITYKHTAVLGLRIKQSEQLNGIPNVTVVPSGKHVLCWVKSSETGSPTQSTQAYRWARQPSSNPAWIALDILTNKRYGAGMALARFNIERWKQWAAWCDANKLEFNGIFESQTNVWDAVQTVMRCGRAQLTRTGTRYDVVIERAEDPSMMFSVANMISGSFSESWLPLQERVNEIEAAYYPAANDYKPSTIRAVDAVALQAGMPQRTTRVDLRGVTNEQQAWDDIWLQLHLNRYVRRTCKFSANIEAIACAPGDVVLVQHDMPQWGFGGRVERDCTTTVLKLDREVTLTAGLTYSAQVHQSKLQRYAGSVLNATSTSDSSSFVISGFDGSTVKRLVVAGRDLEVIGTFASGPDYGVSVPYLSDAASLVGQAATLWDTDVLETRTVVNPAPAGGSATVTQITLTSPLSAAPEQYQNWLFGLTNKTAKPFRVKSISGSHETRRDITCIEYNASVYDKNTAVPTPNYSAAETLQHVTILGVDEFLIPHGLSYQSRVTVRYTSPQQIYRRSKVYLSRGAGLPFEEVGEDPASVTVDAAQGEELTFRVVAIDAVGRQMPADFAPQITYTVAGKVQSPVEVGTLTADTVDGGSGSAGRTRMTPSWSTTKVRVGADWDAAEQVFNAKAAEFVWPWRASGAYTLLFRHFVENDIGSSQILSSALTIQNPGSPTVSAVDQANGFANVIFADPRTTQPIRYVEVRLGTTSQSFATATEVARTLGGSGSASFAATLAGTKRVFLRATDMAGNVGPVAAFDFVVTVAGPDMTPPPALAGTAVSAGMATHWLSWTKPAYTEGGGPGLVRIYAADWPSGTRPVFSAARVVDTVEDPGPLIAERVLTVGTSVRRVYWFKNVTLAGVEQASPSPDATGLSVTSTTIAGTDLGSLVVEAGNLANGAVGATKLAAAAVDATKFANGIEPVAVVSELPTPAGYTGPKTVLLTTDGKLYRYAAGAWTKAVDGADVVANSILAGAIAAGALTAREIAAGAVTTSKLLVTGQGSALNADPNTQDAGAWSGISTHSVLADSSSPNGRALEITSASLTTYSDLLPVDPNKNYSLSLYAKQQWGSSTCYLGVAFFDASGADIEAATAGALGWPGQGTYFYYGLLNGEPPASYTQYVIGFGTAETAKIPANARSMRIVMLANYDVAGVQRFANIRLVEKAGAQLIVDGAITATKLAANSIAVGTAAIANGAIINAMIADATIDNAKIANLNANKITAGTIDVARLAAGSIDVSKLDTRNLEVKDNNGVVILSASRLPGSDGATALNLNPNFAIWPSGVTYPTQWSIWAGSAPTREISIITGGSPYSVRWTAGGETGMLTSYNFATPLAAGSFLEGAFSMYMVANNGGGKPGYLFRLYTNAAQSTYVDTFVPITDQTVGGWQRMGFVAGAGGAAVYGLTIYQMASWTGAPGGSMTTGSQMIFGPLSLEVRTPITAANATTRIANAAIKSALIEDLRSSNYTEDGSGNPTAGVKLSSTGTALKVASGNLQVGTLVFRDYWARLLQGIDGQVGSSIIWRGMNDVTVRNGAPNIACLTVYTWESQVLNSNFQQTYHKFKLQPTTYTAYDDNVDAMTQIHVQYFQFTSSTTPFTEHYTACPSRTYDGVAGAAQGQFQWGWRDTVGPMLESSNQFSGYLRVRIGNTYGWSATKDLAPSTTRGGALGAGTITGVGGQSPAGGGGTGGYCPAPWVKVRLVNGREINAAELHNGARLMAVDDYTLQPIAGGGVVENFQVLWAQRIRVALTDGTAAEFSENHRVATVNRGWVKVQHLRAGDHVVGLSEKIVESVLAVGEGQVCSFRVRGAGTYFAGDLLCHNIKSELP